MVVYRGPDCAIGDLVSCLDAYIARLGYQLTDAQHLIGFDLLFLYFLFFVAIDYYCSRCFSTAPSFGLVPVL